MKLKSISFIITELQLIFTIILKVRQAHNAWLFTMFTSIFYNFQMLKLIGKSYYTRNVKEIVPLSCRIIKLTANRPSDWLYPLSNLVDGNY